ncbi:glutamate racemase [Azorhizobium oxalatiphilum]|uniref:Glutamate racemase n=1 Tax=Azorhizobium oxalatiphilum TaxID=980631 RepID=A0A917FAE9_9HYPH|nr:glutamate racemase [Azorhizobium oxalatiphilum]GGF59691.1 glutamate racemase [Azorhizobium oxalatiphilum]
MADITAPAQRFAAVPSIPMQAPTILVFDSGLGGLSVCREVAKVRPDAYFVYAADDAAFPYGALSDTVMLARVREVMTTLIAATRPDLAVIACNTISTLALPALRTDHAIPFVGTVPAIKPACAASVTKQVSVLATPGTVRRDYTAGLVREFAGSCTVTLVPSERLAGYAETIMRGGEVSDADLWAEVGPCFVKTPKGRTDTIVLACTHYPLVVERLRAIAPWPVSFIDPAPAIARRVASLMGPTAFASSPKPVRVVSTAHPLDAGMIGHILGRQTRTPEVIAPPLARAS